MEPSAAAADVRVPVHVLTGFLGSGKTTLLRHLLSLPGMDRSAVLINEFGEVGLDHLLVREVREDVVLLSSGCLCCTVKDDLVSSLVEMAREVSAGRMPAFERIVVETTGVADPAPILQAVMSERRLIRFYRPGQIAVTVDAVNGAETLARHTEAVDQVALADTVLVTKADLVEDWQLEGVRKAIATINPQAVPTVTGRGPLPLPAALFDDAASPMRDFAASGAGEQHHHHDESVGTFVVALDRPIPWQAFVEWLELLLASRGQDILRVKGLLAIAHDSRPVVIQGVQHVVYPPEFLNAWPEGQRGTRLVFIARNLSKGAIIRSLKDLMSVHD